MAGGLTQAARATNLQKIQQDVQETQDQSDASQDGVEAKKWIEAKDKVVQA
jgi:hypothetical protein